MTQRRFGSKHVTQKHNRAMDGAREVLTEAQQASIEEIERRFAANIEKALAAGPAYRPKRERRNG